MLLFGKTGRIIKTVFRKGAFFLEYLSERKVILKSKERLGFYEKDR